MSALYLKDLADKTRRGLRGRVEAGKSGGGNSYGYDVVRRPATDGSYSTGERTINPAEAAVVKPVFQEHGHGTSPSSIAHALNIGAVPAPRGNTWSASTIHGNAARGTGILNNELYIGRLVWNRLKYIKDPDTGRRVSRPNLESEWIVAEVPDLRIVSQELWEAVKDRQKRSAVPKRGNRGGALGKIRRPRYLLSGLLTCGVCGGGMSMISQTHVGCSAARNKGTCDNRQSIARRDAETRVLDALAHRLMDPELFAVFCEEFVAETNRSRAAAGATLHAKEREFAQVERSLDRLVQALIDGAPASTVKGRMAELEARREQLRAELENQSVPPPALHPNLSKLYRSRVSNLAAALNTPEARREAADSLRHLIDKIILTPKASGYAIDLQGDLAGILKLASDGKDKTAQAGVAEAVSQVSLVAGA